MTTRIIPKPGAASGTSSSKARKVLSLLNARNRFWLLPLAGAGGVALAQYTQNAGFHLQAGLRVSLAGGAGFLAAVTWTLIEDGLRSRKRKPTTEQLAEGIEEQNDQLRTVREGLGELEDRFSEFLAKHEVDSNRLDNSLLDLNHDVATMRNRNPSDELRPQLKAIADKFGELAGVRAVVANLSSKVRKVEGLAGQIKLVEKRIMAAADESAQTGGQGLQALGAKLGDLHQSLSDVLVNDIDAIPLENMRESLESLERRVNSLGEEFTRLRAEVSRATEPEGLSEALARAMSLQTKIPADPVPASLSQEYRSRMAA